MPKVLLRAYRLGGAFVYLLGVLFVMPHAVNWPLWLGPISQFQRKVDRALEKLMAMVLYLHHVQLAVAPAFVERQQRGCGHGDGACLANVR